MKNKINTKKIIPLITFIILIFCFSFLFYGIINAQTNPASTPSTKAILTNTMTNVATNAGYTPESGEGSLIITIGKFVRLILSFLGILFLIFIIISGLQWMTAGGDENAVKQAKTRIKNATIGFVVIILAYAITYFVIGLLTNSSMSVIQ